MRLLSLLFIIILSVNTHAQEAKLKVLSSASMIHDMVKNIGGDAIENKLIVPIGGDPHLYEPTPRDAQKVSAADLIFVNGLTFEGWIIELIKNSGTKATLDTVTNQIKPIGSTVYENSYDPHAWMDVSKGLKYITSIKNSLVKHDPKNAALYESNYKAYYNKLEELDKYITRRIQEIPSDKRVLITTHDAFSYYGKKYGLRLEAIVGISTEAEAQTSDIQRIIKSIKDSGVPAIFIESTIDPKQMKQIAKDNKVTIGGELFADSIGGEDTNANSYYDMLKHNTDVIVSALKGENNGQIKEDKSGSSINAYLILGAIFLLGLLFLIFRLNKS